MAAKGLVAAAIVVAAFAPWHALGQTQPSPEERARLLQWISPACCVSSDAEPAGTGCCFEIEPSEVTELRDGKWRIEATGQVVRGKRSRDGKFWRCACDLVDGSWVVHAGAYTRCLYVFVGS